MCFPPLGPTMIQTKYEIMLKCTATKINMWEFGQEKNSALTKRYTTAIIKPDNGRNVDHNNTLCTRVVSICEKLILCRLIKNAERKMFK